MNEYKLPDVGEGLTEAEIVTWRVAVGDEIVVNDIVVDIETAKSIVELPSPYAGTVLELLVEEGATVEVGTPIIRIGDADEAADSESVGRAVSASDDPIDTNVPPEGQSTLVGYGPRETQARRRPRKGGASPESESAAATQMQVQGSFAPGGAQSDAVVEGDEESVPAVAAQTDGEEKPKASPAVRGYAAERGVDLSSVTPTGPHGNVTREDVEAVGRSVEPVETSGGGRHSAPLAADRREPIKGVRKMMAQAMVDSAFSAPHVTEWVTVDVTRTNELVESLRRNRAYADLAVSPTLIAARAVLLAMQRTPDINSFWDEAAQEVAYHKDVNLGIAAATPRGLVVPNIKSANEMSTLELAGELKELIATARAGKTQPADMAGGTFTITNIGVFGVDGGTPIINPGESAIVCLGQIERRPWVVGEGADERIEPRDVMTLSISFDHRHIDGAMGSRFLADVAGLLADPASALAW